MQNGQMKRTGIAVAIAVLLISVSVVDAIWIWIGAALTSGYYPKSFFLAPAFHYFYVFVILICFNILWIFFIAFYCVTRGDKFKNFIIPALISFFYLPLFFVLTLYERDIPFSVKLNGVWHSAPWEYGPDGNESANGSFLRIRAAYPDFLPLPEKHAIGDTPTSTIMASRQTGPDVLCIGDFGCNARPPVGSRGDPPSLQLLRFVGRKIDFEQQRHGLFVSQETVDGETYEYVYEKNIESGEFKLVGYCSKNNKYKACDLLYHDRIYYYNTHISLFGDKMKGNEDTIQIINSVKQELVSLFDKFAE